MKLPDKVYNVLKWVCLTGLPACEGLYFLLAKIWGFPYQSEIPATINAVAIFIGMLIGISQISINREKKENADL